MKCVYLKSIIFVMLTNPYNSELFSCNHLFYKDLQAFSFVTKKDQVKIVNPTFTNLSNL